MANLSEYLTRRDKIDKMLEKSGWTIKDRNKVFEEVDTKQSDFKSGKYKTVSQTLKDPDEHAYADYLLLDAKGMPLAVIEAKKTSKDPIIGQRQAEGYVDDIQKQTGQPVFIFLTNGYEIWFWNKPFENPRIVKGFHDRKSLERIKFQNNSRKEFCDVPIKREIVDRPYQIEAVKRVEEGIDKGKRKFLLVQATGTGKTRVSMALIDVLMRANRAERVLFIADRKELRDQAYGDLGFKTFFPNTSKTKIYSGDVQKEPRLYASTIQTLMECYQQFNPGDFDVIISDEAHRSIYNKWKDVFTYFDAIEIGLTATPSDLIERDTFRFFECEGGQPTFLYTYDQAIKEKYLVDFQVYHAQTHFQIEGIKPEDIPASVKAKVLEETGTVEEELNFEGTDIEKKVAVIGTNEAIVKEFMDNYIEDRTGTLPAKTIIFAVSKQHAKRLWEAFEKLYPQYKGKLCKIITSDNPRAKQLIDEFKKEDYPKIAISVDMLDTGIDVPEVCNLVFAKPVFSKIKFWQMIGRGTRSDATCKTEHRKWLPNGKKEYFLILDFWKNFEWFKMNPEGKEVKPAEAVTTKIFMTRLYQLEFFQKYQDNRAELIKAKVADTIKSLPAESISIQEHMREIEKALLPNFYNSIGLQPIDYLKTKIAPLMKYMQDVNVNEAYFILKTEQLSLAILHNDNLEIERLKNAIGDDLQRLPLTLNDVKVKRKLLNQVLNNSFWDRITYEDAQMIGEEFAPLMKYRDENPRTVITLDIDDVIQESGIIEFGPLPSQENVNTYLQKVQKRITELAENHPTILKIKNNEVLTEEDLKNLENTLNGPDLYITEEVLQKAFSQNKGTLVQFIKNVLGMYAFPDPKKRVEDAFKTFMVEKNYLNADQVNFLRTVQTVFMKKRHIDYEDFYELPFTNFGFTMPLADEDLKEVVQLCASLEREIKVASP
ncbi:MAG: DEAD/DEAH box helicase family protein [Methanocella sp.]